MRRLQGGRKRYNRLMNTKTVLVAVAALVVGFLVGHFLFAPSESANADIIQSVVQSKEKMYEAEAQTCLQLAQNAYLRDFIALCKKDQPSPSCDSTDFNSASSYGVFQLGANPSGDFAMLYKTYQSDTNLCTNNSGN